MLEEAPVQVDQTVSVCFKNERTTDAGNGLVCFVGKRFFEQAKDDFNT
jgi:hypothetical protein